MDHSALVVPVPSRDWPSDIGRFLSLTIVGGRSVKGVLFAEHDRRRRVSGNRPVAFLLRVFSGTGEVGRTILRLGGGWGWNGETVVTDAATHDCVLSGREGRNGENSAESVPVSGAGGRGRQGDRGGYGGAKRWNRRKEEEGKKKSIPYRSTSVIGAVFRFLRAAAVPRTQQC